MSDSILLIIKRFIKTKKKVKKKLPLLFFFFLYPPHMYVFKKKKKLAPHSINTNHLLIYHFTWTINKTYTSFYNTIFFFFLKTRHIFTKATLKQIIHIHCLRSYTWSSLSAGIWAAVAAQHEAKNILWEKQ